MIAGGDRAAMPLDNPASQGQAKPGAFGSSGVKGLENPFLFAGRNAFASVANLEDQMAIRLNLKGDIDGTSGRRGIACVVQ